MRRGRVGGCGEGGGSPSWGAEQHPGRQGHVLLLRELPLSWRCCWAPPAPPHNPISTLPTAIKEVYRNNSTQYNVSDFEIKMIFHRGLRFQNNLKEVEDVTHERSLEL